MIQQATDDQDGKACRLQWKLFVDSNAFVRAGPTLAKSDLQGVGSNPEANSPAGLRDTNASICAATSFFSSSGCRFGSFRNVLDGF